MVEFPGIPLSQSLGSYGLLFFFMVYSYFSLSCKGVAFH